MGERPAISGETRLAGLIGWPARHSLSPTILDAAFQAAGLDWTFLVFEVPPGQGPAAIDAMRSLGIGGLSVTMPHKADVAAAVDERTPEATVLEAVNCVYWHDGRLVGHNTDGPGFVDALRLDQGIEVAGRRCLVVGAGGAGRAVIRALADAGADQVVVVNRSAEAAERAAELAGRVGRVGYEADIVQAELVVNTTPLGMAGTAHAAALPFDPELLQPGQVVADAVYSPLTTPLLAAARQRGAVGVDGLGMLIHQAAHAFRRWTGLVAPVEAMAAAARSELDRRALSGLTGTRLDGDPPQGAT